MIFKFTYSRNNIQSIKKFLKVFNITMYSYVDLFLSVDISKSYFFNKSIPIFNYNKSLDNHDSPFFFRFYNLTNIFESMIISTSKTTSFLKSSYKDSFSSYLYHDFLILQRLIHPKLNYHYLKNSALSHLIEKGFRSIAFNIFESLRFIWMQNIEEKSDIINNKKWVDIDFLLLFIAKPWYDKILEIMQNKSDNFLNGARVVQISVFIVVIVIFILCYFIIWKSYEDSLELLLQRSFDLINLIPEEIKYLIVSKLNE